jgi:hypothetical protein
VNAQEIEPQDLALATRRSEFDVTNEVKTTDPAAVSGEVHRIYLELYPSGSPAVLNRAFADCSSLYVGEYPGYHRCDTSYHDLQHVLDVTLAMARLMNGYERSRDRSTPIGDRLFAFGIVTALFHDIGYLRHRHDTRHRNGAEYTLKHVSRGARFLEQYMSEIGMADLAAVAGSIVHFTGYEVPVHEIEVPNLLFRMMGNMLGTADIIAQMADRCYLEKCRDRLYPEFVAGGLASDGVRSASRPMVLFHSAKELLTKTPNFYRTASLRLSEQLGAAYRYMQRHFGGQNLYLDEVSKNVRYAERIAEGGDLSLLRRNPPEIPAATDALQVRLEPRHDAAGDPSEAALPAITTL